MLLIRFYQAKKTLITMRRPSFLSRSPLCPSHYPPGRSPLKEKWWHVFHNNNCMLSIFSHFTLINANERVCRRLCLLLRLQQYIQLRSNVCASREKLLWSDKETISCDLTSALRAMKRRDQSATKQMHLV